MTKIEQCYRGIVYRRTSKGIWIFDTPPAQWGHWNRFFEDDEIKALVENTIPVKEQQKIMERGVDRMLAKSPCYTGDLRFRGAATEMNKGVQCV